MPTPKYNNGRFVIGWPSDENHIDANSPAADEGGQAKIYNADGTALVDGFLVNNLDTDGR